MTLIILSPVAPTAICWWFGLPGLTVFFGIVSILLFGGLLMTGREIARQRAFAAQLPHNASCAFARSFEFRRTDTLVMRAVYEELQPLVGFPIEASHRLSEDLRLDDEDLSLEIAPVIAQRLGGTLGESEKNPYYGRVQTVEDLVHFMEEQPSEKPEKA